MIWGYPYFRKALYMWISLLGNLNVGLIHRKSYTCDMDWYVGLIMHLVKMILTMFPVLVVHWSHHQFLSHALSRLSISYLHLPSWSHYSSVELPKCMGQKKAPIPNGHFRNLNWRYLPCIRPTFQAEISGNLRIKYYGTVRTNPFYDPGQCLLK